MLRVSSPASPALNTSQHAMLPVDLLNRIRNNDPQASASVHYLTAFSKHHIERALCLHCLTVVQLKRVAVQGTFLSNNAAKSLGVSGACILARALASNSNVTVIDLRGNNIASEGVHSLLPPLSSLSSLRSLDLSFNGLAPTDACHVIHTLARCAVRCGGFGCSSLCMEGNCFTPKDVVACQEWSCLQLPVPPAHTVQKGFGEIVAYLSGDNCLQPIESMCIDHSLQRLPE
jgi:hypothetical protein